MGMKEGTLISTMIIGGFSAGALLENPLGAVVGLLAGPLVYQGIEYVSPIILRGTNHLIKRGSQRFRSN